MTDLVEKYIERTDEVVSAKNIGFEEMVKFYQNASKSELKMMEKLLKDKDTSLEQWAKFKSLIRKVLGVNLK